MLKKFLLIAIFCLLSVNTATAQDKIPILITPDQVITTSKDKVEIGDILDFKVVNDVYKDEKIIIKKGAPVEAIVDYVNPNGWACDTAYIQIKTFKILDAKNKWIDVDYLLKIKGKDSQKKTNKIAHTTKFLGALVKGFEVKIEPNQKNFNIFMFY